MLNLLIKTAKDFQNLNESSLIEILQRKLKIQQNNHTLHILAEIYTEQSSVYKILVTWENYLLGWIS